MIKTGIGYLDKITGGYLLGDNIVWQVSDGVPVDIFINSFFKNVSEFNENVVFVNFNYSPQTIYKKYRPIFEGYNTILVDAFTNGKGNSDSVFLDFYKEEKTGGESYCIENPKNINEFKKLLNEIENRYKDGSFYIFDSLTGMNELWKDETSVLDFFSFTCPKLYDLNTLAYWVYEKDAHSKEFIASLSHITQVVFSLSKAHSNYFELCIRKLEGRSSYQMNEPFYFRIMDEDIEFQERRDVLIKIGERVKELRKEKHLTQAELASSLHMTSGAVSQIENDLISPSLHTLVQMSEIFEKPIDYFIRTGAEDEANRGFEVIKNPMKVSSPARNAGIFRVLETEGDGLKIYSVEIVSGKNINGPLFFHKGDEIIYVARGSLYITIDGDVHYLKYGDALHIKRSFIEKMQNRGSSDCTLIYILK
jgi:transcriptional regulator with XRE-family HTH domain